MGDVTGVGKAAEGFGKIAEVMAGVIRPFTDPVFEASGQYVATRVQFANWKQSVRMVEDAQRILARKGLAAGPVPPKLLVPILENAALEQEDLLERWSNMLARASAGERVHPSYSEILKQLTPQDVARWTGYIEILPGTTVRSVPPIRLSVMRERRSAGMSIMFTSGSTFSRENG